MDYFCLLMPMLMILLVGSPLWLITWAVNPESRLPAALEAVAPLRGKWLRYLVAAFCLPLSVVLPFVVVFLLALVPPLVGVACAAGAVGWYLVRMATQDRQLADTALLRAGLPTLPSEVD